jgi:uncharacterized protein (TIGR03437 family)
VTLTPTAASNSAAVTIPINLVVSSTALIQVSPSELTFSFAPGAATSQTQTLAVTSTGDALTYSAISGAPWLSIGPTTGTTPANVNVTANVAGMQAGVYTGSLTVLTQGGNSQTIPVRLTIASGTLALDKNTLEFSQPAGASAPAAQVVNVRSSAGSQLPFSVAPFGAGVASWLTVTPTQGTTPQAVNISVNGTNLVPGVYTGGVVIQAPGASNTPQTVQVVFNVGQAQSMTLSRNTLNISTPQGQSATETVRVEGSAPNMTYTTQVATSTGGQWLTVTPANGSIPQNLTITATPTNLTPGSYTGTVTVSSPGVPVPQVITVNLNVGRPVPATAQILNAASSLAQPIAPGEMIAIKGSNLGPVNAVQFQAPGGRVETSLGGTRVLFDGIEAPILYAQANQVNAIVPYEVANRVSTRMVVDVQGTRTEPLELRVADVAPAIFTASTTGTGQGAILNQDLTINTAQRPAAKGSVIAVYGTGEGQTNPPGATGTISNVVRRAIPIVTATVGGVPAIVEYAGSAPGLVSGVFQVNLRLPENIPSGAVPVVLRFATAETPAGVPVAVK